MELEGSKTRGQSSLNGPTVPAGNYAAVLTECVPLTRAGKICVRIRASQS